MSLPVQMWFVPRRLSPLPEEPWLRAMEMSFAPRHGPRFLSELFSVCVMRIWMSLRPKRARTLRRFQEERVGAVGHF